MARGMPRERACRRSFGAASNRSYSFHCKMDPDSDTWRFADGGSWGLRERSRVVGILNVTPDSFSDGGRFLDPDRAVARGIEMAEEGADAIDVGGESTRPGSSQVPLEEELRRVIPVIRALQEHLGEGSLVRAQRVRISVDTSKAAVAAAALDAGADIVNDVTGLRGDPAMAPLVSRTGAAVVLMHMRGEPRTMQEDPRYEDLMAEIERDLRASWALAREAGIRDDRIVLDPGIGFGKTADHNLEILDRLPLLAEIGRPILVGVSRKSFLGKVTGLPAGERLEASLAAGAVAVVRGAAILRVHDVAASVRMVRTIDAIVGAGRKVR